MYLENKEYMFKVTWLGYTDLYTETYDILETHMEENHIISKLKVLFILWVFANQSISSLYSSLRDASREAYRGKVGAAAEGS